jgi:hypothetical protein
VIRPARKELPRTTLCVFELKRFSDPAPRKALDKASIHRGAVMDTINGHRAHHESTVSRRFSDDVATPGRPRGGTA